MGQVICFNALIDNLVCAVSLDSRYITAIISSTRINADISHSVA